MAELSKKIHFYDEDKLAAVNPQTLQLWKKYKIDMSLRELSPKTIAAYENDLQHWWIYIYDNQDNRSVTELTDDDITEFLYFCKMEGNNSRRMKRRMSSISAFYKFLRKKRLIIENPMEFLDRPKKDVDVMTQTFLTKDQVAEMREKLAANIENSKTVLQKHAAMQLYCYAFLSLSTMARVNAISSIKWDQVEFETRSIKDVVEKEGYIVTLYFAEYVREALQKLQAYRAEYGITDDGYLFVSRNGVEVTRVTNSTLNQWCKEIGGMINVPTLHPHDFRHSGATLLKNAGMSLEDVSALLHHQSTDVTKKSYIKEDATRLSVAKDQFEI